MINTGFKEGPGQHYVAFYIEKDSKVTYFDSFGLPPWTCLEKFWTNVVGATSVEASGALLQSPLSSVCGYYCLAFLYCKDRGATCEDFLNCFTPNSSINDQIVVSFVERL